MFKCSMAIRRGSGGKQELTAAEREDRERALANAEAIIGFAGASGTPEMQAPPQGLGGRRHNHGRGGRRVQPPLRVTAYPYLMPGTDTLRNRLGITDSSVLGAAEADYSKLRIAQLEAGRQHIRGRWDLAHLQAVHRFIFGDVYPWGDSPIRTSERCKRVFGNSRGQRSPISDRRFRRVYLTRLNRQ